MLGNIEGMPLPRVVACMGWLASPPAAGVRSFQDVQTSPACRLTTGAPRLLPLEMQVMQLALAGCRAVAEFMRQRLLEYTEVGAGHCTLCWMHCVAVDEQLGSAGTGAC